jgi:hypothetical protein
MNLNEQINSKLTPIESFALRAKMDLTEFEDDENNEGYFMTQDHIEGFSIKENPFLKAVLAKMEGKLVARFDIKKLRKALLYFQRNGCENIELIIDEDKPIILNDKEIFWCIAPRVE